MREFPIDVPPIRMSDPSDMFDKCFAPHLPSHPTNPSILESILQRVYEARGWATYVMYWFMDWAATYDKWPVPHHGVNESLVGCTVFEWPGLICEELNMLICHGVPVFMVATWELHRSLKSNALNITAKQVQREESEVQAKIRDNSSSLKDCMVWVHMELDCLHHIAHWVIDHPHEAKEVPMIQMATELGLFNNPQTQFYMGQGYIGASWVFGYGCLETTPPPNPLLPADNPFVEQITEMMDTVGDSNNPQSSYQGFSSGDKGLNWEKAHK